MANRQLTKQVKVGKRMRYSDAELSLIKNTFAEQEELLVLLRKFLLQGNLTASELSYLKSYTDSPAVIKVLKKAICPVMDKQAPAFQTVDLFSNIAVDTIPTEHANLIIKSRQLAVQYLNERFDELAGEKVEDPIMFDELITGVEEAAVAHLNLVTRNFILSHVDSQLFNSVLVMAGTKDEDPEEQKRRLTQDSAQ